MNVLRKIFVVFITRRNHLYDENPPPYRHILGYPSHPSLLFLLLGFQSCVWKILMLLFQMNEPLPKKPRRNDSQRTRRGRVRRKDKAFQLAGEKNVCDAGGHYSEQTTWHHVKKRMHMETRWDDTVCWRLCVAHHQEAHSIGDRAFSERYGLLPMPDKSGDLQEGTALQTLPPEND